MSTFVVEYKRKPELETLDFAGAIPAIIESDYLNQLSEIIMNKPHIVPTEDNIPQEIQIDLVNVVNFRSIFLQRIGIYDSKKFD